ncbi:GNAT family N-acetyltransferase [Clostridium sulfidigenes]|uniref:GNAT family N-acetyltransferase n=1 Tax=Clostridium sulfidigenes TaxID=318464 RepID=UPI003F8A37A0
MFELILIGGLMFTSTWFYYSRKDIKKRNEYLEQEYERLNSLRDSSNEEYRNKILNSKRIANSNINFELKESNEVLVIKDELDYMYKGIDIYVSNKKDIDLYMGYDEIIDMNIEYGNGVKKIALIDLYREKEGIYKIEKLRVLKDYRRNGIATFMMERVIEWAKLREVKELYLFASADRFFMSQSDLMKFYSEFGFISEGSDYMRLKLK